eukprot:3437428-Prymnesium_polylepis.1
MDGQMDAACFTSPHPPHPRLANALMVCCTHADIGCGAPVEESSVFAFSAASRRRCTASLSA